MPRARRRTRRRTRRRVLLAAAAVVVTVLVLLAGGNGDDPRAGSEDLGRGRQPVGIVRTPAAYRIDYRVETRSNGDVRTSSERVRARRPFASRVERFSGPVPGGDPATTQVANFGRLEAAGQGVDDLVVVPPPGPAPGDLRVAAVLEDAVEAGLLETRELRRVAGRVCQVYRSSGLLGAMQTLAPHEDGEHADTCIDEAGLLLEEVLFDAEGDVAVRRVAIEVDEEPSFDEQLFDVGEATVPPRQGGGVVTPLRPDSRTPGTFWELEAPPEGFEHRGRYAVVPPQVEAFTDPLQRDRRLGSVIDVYVSGPDVIVIDRGGTTGGVDVLPDVPHAERVAAGALGTAELLFGASGSEIRVDLGGGRFVRLLGTVTSAELIDVAGGLEEVEGGALDPLTD